MYSALLIYESQIVHEATNPKAALEAVGRQIAQAARIGGALRQQGEANV
jgi:hypothetical protein